MVAVVSSFGCEVEDEPGPAGGGYEGLSLNDSGSTIRVDDDWKACETTADCVLVSTSCDACCAQEAIARSREQEFGDASQDLCADYEGAQCDCAPEPSEARCSQGLCQRIVVDGGW